MLLLAIVMEMDDDLGCALITGTLCVSLLIGGIHLLTYYFTMARHMVGGKSILYRGILLTDVGIFTAILADIPNKYIMLYLLGYNLFVGAIDVLRALEARGHKSHSYKMKLVFGAVSVVTSVAGLFFMDSQAFMVDVYCVGLVISACGRIAGAFRRTSIVYIQ